MKFLCVSCDAAMKLQARDSAQSNGLNLTFRCPACGHEFAMLTNTGEAQLVQSLGVQLGQPAGPPTPMAGLRAHLAAVRPHALAEQAAPEPHWTPAALARLKGHPRFVQPVIRKQCNDYARREGLREITPAVMDAARQALG